jgi:hypothetical protein
MAHVIKYITYVIFIYVFGENNEKHQKNTLFCIPA